MYEVVLEIERDDIRGGQLLNVLNKRCHCGVPELRTCLQSFFGTDIKSCIINLWLGWSMGFSRILMENFLLRETMPDFVHVVVIDKFITGTYQSDELSVNCMVTMER